ncbi:MAG: J domain-containing protein [Sphingobacteriales bacterium]|nr:MAG: J domain-containing protein [Sphingobacteriales bacterium]
MEAYPLTWPMGYPRTEYPSTSRFDTSQHLAQEGLMKELRMLGADDIIISTNIPLRKDGLPYANYQKSLVKNGDYGVAVYFNYKNNPVVLACDKWDKLGDNMQAIRKAVEAIRGLERWGVSDMLNRVFTGFKALPERASESFNSWWQILEIKANASAEEIKDAYRKKAKIYHPDKPTGDKMKFLSIQEAYKEGININKSS